MNERTVASVFTAACLTAACWVTTGAAEPGAPPSQAELAVRIDEYLRPLERAGDLSGTLLVAQANEVVYEGAFGKASYELGVANTAETRFGVASLTKPITAIVLIRLMERGKLAPADSLGKWIPDFPRGGEITIEHLARHRSGLPHRVTGPADEVVPRRAADMVELAKRATLLFEPGTETRYSSTGYSVLARVLELAGNKSWPELVQELVLAPAGAGRTAHPRPFELMLDRAESYYRGPDGPIPAPLKDLSFLVGAGSLYSTPRDLWAIQRTLLSGGYGELARSELLDDGGLFWNGITNGFRAFADHHPGADVTVIFTGNLFTAAGDLLRRNVPRIVAGEEVATPEVPVPTPVTLPAALADRYEGIYQLRAGVADSEERLEVHGPVATLGDWVLIPTSETTFWSPQDYETVRVSITEAGVVDGLLWGNGDEASKLPRMGPVP